MAKIIKAVFTGRFCKTARVFQFDAGDALQFVNLNLPENYSVDFANSKTGESKTVLASSDTVAIPPEFFVPGSEIYAWVWISDSDGGYTKCEATIPVDQRAERTESTPTPAQQTALDEAINALNSATQNIPSEINAALEEAKDNGAFDGASAYEIAVDQGYEGTEAEWLESLQGAPGAPGVPGDDYVLTDEDRADIALDVAETVLEPTTVSGNPLVISDGVGGTRPLSLLCEVEAAEAVTLTRTGKNIWNSARLLEADGWTLEEDGSYSGYNSELYYSFGRLGKSMFGNTAWNEQVTVSFDLRKDESSTVENAIEIVLNYADGTKTSRQNRGPSTWQHCSVSSTIGKTIASIQFTYGSKAKIWLKNFQVEFNGADTGYQPYAATVYQLPIPDAPASGTIDLTEAARDAVTMLEGANVFFADCTSLTMTYPVRPAGSGGNVQSVNGKTGEVVLSASDVHALPDTTEIPSRTSQLQNDSGYLTQHQSLAAYRTSQAQDEIDRQQNTAIEAKYTKPGTGIPKTDLASAVQTSLGKADTALQSAPVTSVNGQTGAVTLSIPSTASDVGAVAADQGAANANKVLTVNSSGVVVPEDNRFVVTLTPTAQDFSGVMDKTCAEITAAYEAGKDIWLEVDATAMGYDLWRVKATIEAKASGENYGQVMGFLINLQLTPPSMIFIFTEFNTSGDENRYTTQIYPLATGQWTGGSY